MYRARCSDDDVPPDELRHHPPVDPQRSRAANDRPAKHAIFQEELMSMSRTVHLVGAWPGEFGADAMDTAFKRLGPKLARMSDGETGDRSLWLLPTMAWMRANPDVERQESAIPVRVVERETEAGEDEKPKGGGFYRLREGSSLESDHIQMGYVFAFKQSYPAFKVLRERYEQPDVSFQVGIPSPLDLTRVAFGVDAMLEPSLTGPFTVATTDQITQILADAGDDVIFQIETVGTLLAVAMSAPEDQPAVAEQMASELVRLVEQVPEGTRFGAHLCLGNFQHKASMQLSDARPLVLLANALAKHFPAGRQLEYIHAPLAAAALPPSLDEEWYAPLSELDLGDVRFIAGFVHETLDIEQLTQLLATIERFAGCEVDVSSTCGLGRLPSPDMAWDMMEKASELVDL